MTARGLPGGLVSASPTGGIPAWVTGTVYPVNTLVSNSGTNYICNTAHTAAATFGADAANWTALGSGGGGAGVSSFNTRSGAITLSRADVTGTGLAAADVGADVSGAAASEATRAQAAEALAALKSANLSDLANAATARTNLGLGSAATHPSTDFDAAGLSAAETTRAEAAEALLAPLASPAFTGHPVGVTETPGTNSTRLASTAYADAAVAATVASRGLYGDGSDGDVTISGTITLTRDMQYNNLTLNGTIETSGFRVFVRGALTGAGAVQLTAPAGGSTGTIPFSSSTYYAGAAAGQRMQGGAGNTGAGSAPSQAHDFSTSLGAQGGVGGAGSSGAGGAAGSLNPVATSVTGVSSAANLHPMTLLIGHGFLNTGATSAPFNGGTGGGGGGGDGVNKGGGGGCGGYVVVVFAFDASSFTGTIRALGGAGGSPVSGNCGGGGGGGGGFAALFARTLPTGSYTISAAGGSHGSGVGTGSAGSDGAAGTTIAAIV